MNMNRNPEKGQILAMLSMFNNIRLQLGEATEAVVSAEFKMRLIGELYSPVRDKINVLATRKDQSDYWNCNLKLVAKVLIEEFAGKVDKDKLERIKEFPDRRNALLHGNFIELLDLLGLPKSGRECSGDGTRNTLESKDMKESISSVSQNRGLADMRTLANVVNMILDDIILMIPDEA